MIVSIKPNSHPPLLSALGERLNSLDSYRKIFPNVGVSVFSKTFIVKTINLGNLARFVISAQNGYPLTKSNLKLKEIFWFNIEISCFKNLQIGTNISRA